MWSKLLINESPLQVIPSLAKAIGLNEAIVLQQMHYWSDPKKRMGTEEDGFRWVRNSVREWTKDNFPFWGKSTVQRVLKSLVANGLLYARNDLNQHKYDKTVWYALNYERIFEVEEAMDNEALLELKTKKVDFNKLTPVPDWDTLSENGTPVSKGSPRLGQPVPDWDTPSEDGTAVQRELSQDGTTIPEKENKEEITTETSSSKNSFIVTSDQWLEILDVLQASLSADVFKAAFQYVSFQGTGENRINLKVDSKSAAEWINEKIQDRILYAVYFVLGRDVGEVKVWATV